MTHPSTSIGTAWGRFELALDGWLARRPAPDAPVPAALLDAFAALAAAPDLGRRVVAELRRVVAEPTHAPTPASLHAWVLWTGPDNAKLTLARIPAGSGDDASYLTDAPARQLITTLAGETTTVALYHQIAPDPEVMSPDDALVPGDTVALRPGEVLSLRARRDVLDILPAPEPRHLLILDGPRELTQQWVYRRDDLRPVSPVAADPHDARIESAMRVLRVLGHTPGLPALAALASHPAHFVRWSAIRHVAALDVDLGRELLAGARGDPHPHVRAAAERALTRLAAP